MSAEPVDCAFTPMDRERIQMLETLGKIRDFYYGVNEGVANLADDNMKEEKATAAAASVTSFTTRDGSEKEDFVTMSLYEF